MSARRKQQLGLAGGPSTENGGASDEDESLDEEDMNESLDESSESENEAVEDTNTFTAQCEVPKTIDFKHGIVSICCHPKKNIIASGSIDGPVILHSFDNVLPNAEIASYNHHKKHCRVVRYSDSGDHLFTCSHDASICVLDMETSSIFRKFSRIDGSAIYSLLPIDDYFLASGEDNGEVVLWDFRMQTPVQCFEECSDYISSLTVNREKKVLLATSGDGTLSTYNIRGKKMIMHSEDFDTDLLCAGIFKNGTKVAAGAGDGSINIFNWDEFGDMSDRFPGHPGSVDSMVVLHDDVVCTGCEDGKIRAVQLFPNRFLGVLGNHCGFSVEGLSLSHDKSLLASCSYDQKIRFWDLSCIKSAREEEVKETKTRKLKVNTEVGNFYEDM